MRTRGEIEREVVETLAKAFNLPKERLVLSARLVQDLDLDSIDAIDLAVQLEAHIGVTPKGEDLRTLRTVGDVVDFVERNQGAAAGQAPPTST